LRHLTTSLAVWRIVAMPPVRSSAPGWQQPIYERFGDFNLFLRGVRGARSGPVRPSHDALRASRAPVLDLVLKQKNDDKSEPATVKPDQADSQKKKGRQEGQRVIVNQARPSEDPWMRNLNTAPAAFLGARRRRGMAWVARCSGSGHDAAVVPALYRWLDTNPRFAHPGYPRGSMRSMPPARTPGPGCMNSPGP
jgi:hypothetical protein